MVIYQQMKKYSGGTYSKPLSLSDGLEMATLEVAVLWEKVVSSPWLPALKTQVLGSFDTHPPFLTPSSQGFR